MRYVISDTGAGWVGIVASERGLVTSTYPRPSPEEAARLIRVYRARHAPELFDDLLQRIRQYFAGQPVDFPCILDLSSATEFQRQVWRETRAIPYGEVRSYRWVAQRIGAPRAARAVGQALSRNPLPVIVPCHRVVTTDGKLGGFGGGLPLKERLLRLENHARASVISG